MWSVRDLKRRIWSKQATDMLAGIICRLFLLCLPASCCRHTPSSRVISVAQMLDSGFGSVHREGRTPRCTVKHTPPAHSQPLRNACKPSWMRVRCAIYPATAAPSCGCDSSIRSRIIHDTSSGVTVAAVVPVYACGSLQSLRTANTASSTAQHSTAQSSLEHQQYG